jgi:hypothetical protein
LNRLWHCSKNEVIDGVVSDGDKHFELGDRVRPDVAILETLCTRFDVHYSPTSALYSA